MEGDYSEKYTEEHHIFGGANRKLSTKYGLTVRLCIYHHREGKEAVHNNHEKMMLLKALGSRHLLSIIRTKISGRYLEKITSNTTREDLWKLLS